MANETWGGRRDGSGRKRLAPRALVPHRSRESVERLLPVHVTLRMANTVYNLRSERSFNALKRALRGAADRFGTRIIHFSVQGNHIHLIVETPDRESLYRAMKGLSVRIARRMNRMMNRKGQVIGSRYHTNVLRSHRATWNVLHYVRENHRKHFGKPGEWRTGISTDYFSSWAKPIPLPAPKTTYLRYAES
jgi:REP element-mobilizing transposase RayT